MNAEERILPPGWTRKKLGDVLGLQNGYAFKQAEWARTGKPIIRIQNLNSRSASHNYYGGILPDKFSAKPGDLLFAWSGTPGTSFGAHVWSGPDAWINQHIFRVDFSERDFDRDYLKLALNYNLGDYIAEAQGGVGLAHITKAKLNDSLLIAPPVSIQRSIARLIADFNSKRADVSEHLDAALRAIEQFRRAVLAAACSGRLTTDWRESHAVTTSAHDLVKAIELRHLRSRFKVHSVELPKDSLPTSWCWTTVGSLVDVATGATPLRRRADYYGGTIPWVTSGAVNAGLIQEAAENITELAIRETNAKIFPAGTLLVAMYGEGQTRGRVAELGISAATNQAVAALLFDNATEYLQPYLKLFFLENYERIRALSFGGVQPNLSLGAIRDTVLPLPPKDEQGEIVRRVDQLLETANGLKGRIDAASWSIDRSSQAILTKAFRGELSEKTA